MFPSFPGAPQRDNSQEGNVRAGRGKQTSTSSPSSQAARCRFGRGFSTINLRYFRTFFLAYHDRVPEIRDLGGGQAPAAATAIDQAGGDRAIRHLRGEHPAARRFYEIEAEQQRWSADHLERQIHTQLFACLLKSRDKAGVMNLASRGQALDRPIDAIKHPYVLDGPGRERDLRRGRLLVVAERGRATS